MTIASLLFKVLKNPIVVQAVTSPKVRKVAIEVYYRKRLRKKGVEYILDGVIQDEDVIVLRGQPIGRILINNDVLIFGEDELPTVVPEITLVGSTAKFVIKKLTQNTQLDKIAST